MEPSNRKHLSPGTEREHKVFPTPNTELKVLGLQHLFESLAGEKTCESPRDPDRGAKETMERGQFSFFLLILCWKPRNEHQLSPWWPDHLAHLSVCCRAATKNCISSSLMIRVIFWLRGCESTAILSPNTQSTT